MRVAVIADVFPPMRSSGAVQIRDLSREFARQGHSICVIVPADNQKGRWGLEMADGAQVLRLKAPKMKDIGFVRRTLAECWMPFAMMWNFKQSPLANEVWDGVIWYAPSIFHGPFVRLLKNSGCSRSYLIIRDVFPQWAADLGLMRRGLVFRFFDAVARYQYSLADVIGVQTAGNKKYFKEWVKQPNKRLEVLHNWLGRPEEDRCSIRLCHTALAGRKVFVYAGNMGLPQNMDILLDLAEAMLCRTDVGFLFVGRGTESRRLRGLAHSRRLSNVVFFDEIDPDQIPDLYEQCTAGIVALDNRHKSHNIPGKFLTYMQSGLPVLANINKDNDLADLIRNNAVGQVCESDKLDELLALACKLLEQAQNDPDLPGRCKELFRRQFSVIKAVKKIASALSE